MKRSLSIIYLIVFLFTSTQFSQLLKIPLLVEHYIDYKGSFADFMIHHYGGHEKDEDWDIDMQLPFMTPIATIAIDIWAPNNLIEIKEPATYIKNRRIPSLNDGVPDHRYYNKLIQPPRFS